MKPKTIEKLAHAAALRLFLEPRSVQYDYFCAGFGRGVRCARRNIGAVMHRGRLVSAIKN